MLWKELEGKKDGEEEDKEGTGLFNFNVLAYFAACFFGILSFIVNITLFD